LQFPTHRPVILCVDDDPAQLAAHAAVLSGAGYEILTATNAAAGLHLLTHNPVELVISDHVMHELSGAVLLTEMKRIRPGVRVILFSAFADAPDNAEYADVFLTKGMSSRDFLNVIHGLLEGRATSVGNPA
jgi:DNA-binding NtrC family response regulator